jgi:hypothetical protein
MVSLEFVMFIPLAYLQFGLSENVEPQRSVIFKVRELLEKVEALCP